MEYSAVVSFIPARMLFILPPVLALFHLLCYSLIVIYRSSHPSWWGLFLYIIFCCLSYMSQSYIHPPNHLGPLLQIQYLIYPISDLPPVFLTIDYAIQISPAASNTIGKIFLCHSYVYKSFLNQVSIRLQYPTSFFYCRYFLNLLYFP